MNDKIRNDFPILAREVYKKPLIYLDNAATTQIPSIVIDRICKHYYEYNANVHRGNHYLSEMSSMHIDLAREKTANFINSPSEKQIVFTSGTTDSINSVALNFMEKRLKENDEIIVSELEHHSNFVVWQQLCIRKKAVLKIIPIIDGNLDMDKYEEMLNDRVKLVAITQVSNVTGTVTDIDKIIELAHEKDVPVLVDGAQGIRHFKTDVVKMDCDFYCFSGHKMMAPTGVGVLYIKEKWIDHLYPHKFGGGMVDKVTHEETTFAEMPYILEPGTPNYSGVIGLGQAIDYLETIGIKEIAIYEEKLVDYIHEKLCEIQDVKILGNPKKRAGVVSFNVEGLHPYDLGSILDKLGIAVRSGTHCAKLVYSSLGQVSSVRVSPAFYNTFEEIDYFCESLIKAIEMLKRWS